MLLAITLPLDPLDEVFMLALIGFGALTLAQPHTQGPMSNFGDWWWFVVLTDLMPRKQRNMKHIMNAKRIWKGQTIAHELQTAK